jgi:hypothetical protein
LKHHGDPRYCHASRGHRPRRLHQADAGGRRGHGPGAHGAAQGPDYSPVRGPRSAPAPAKVLKSAGNLTLVVDNLERDGHVTRQRDPEDRRFVTVSLTPQGRAFISELFPRVAAAITREFSGLTAAEQTTLADLCKKAGRGPAL